MPYGYGASKDYSPSKSSSNKSGGGGDNREQYRTKQYTKPKKKYTPPPGEKGGPGYVPPPPKKDDGGWKIVHEPSPEATGVTRPSWVTKKKYPKGIVDTKKYRQFLKNLLGNDPLFSVYEEEGLLDPSNIKHYLSDPRAIKDPAWAKEMKSGAWGYTRPWGDDPSLYIRDIENFGEVPKGPLHATREEVDWAGEIMPTDLFGKPVGVDKFGNTINAPITWKDYYIERGELENLYSGPTIAEKNKRIAEVIGHEARHQVLGKDADYFPSSGYQDPYSQEVNKALNVSDLPGKGTHELITTMGDFQSFNNPTIYDDIYEDIHGGMPRHLSSNVADKLYDASTQFTKDTLARQSAKPYEQIDPIMQKGYEKQLAQDRLNSYIDPIMVEGFKKEFGPEFVGEQLGYYNQGGLVNLFKYGGYLG